MGGMWGAIPNKAPYFEGIYKKNFRKVGKKFWADMKFLEKYVWEHMRNDHLAHDEFYCPLGSERKFSLQRNGPEDFVGNKFDEHNEPLYSLDSRT